MKKEKKNIIYNLQFWIVVIGLIILFLVLYYSWNSICFGCGGLSGSVGEPLHMPIGVQLRIESAKYYADGWVNATIKNVGTVNFDVGKLGVYVDGVLSVYAPNSIGTMLSPGQAITLNITNGTAACPDEVLKIVAENMVDNRIINCNS